MRGRAAALVVVGFLALAGVLIAHGRPAVAQQAPRKAIKTASDLPAFTYAIAGSQDDVTRSEAAFRPLAEKLRRDIESLLRDYVIEDRSFLRELHRTLLLLDMLENRPAEARKEIALVRDLEDRPVPKLMGTLFHDARLDSGWPKPDPQEFFRRFSAALKPLPWDVIGDQVKTRKGNLERRPSANQTPPVAPPNAATVPKTQDVDFGTAQALVNSRFQLAFVTPLKDQQIEAFAAYIEAHKDAPPKPNIWPARSVTLDAAAKAQPVVIGIWDSGVDRSLFRGQLATDGPVPGIDIYGNPTEGELNEKPQARGAALPPQALVSMTQAYAHGTHVAGIALEGNPFGRLAVVRLGLPYQALPDAIPEIAALDPPLTVSGIRKFAAGTSQLTAYLRKQGARVVNMSWGGAYDRLEKMLRVGGVGADAAERRRLAQQMGAIVLEGLRAALASTPEILYVVSAGNDSVDTSFQGSLWALLSDVPNLIVVGAVDEAGNQTGFTSFGPTVTVYANGFQVESYVPGGARVKMSGTSQAAPNVTNLAAKLFALDPSLKPADVVTLIKDGSDRSADGRFRLINPKRSVELLQARRR